MDLGGAIRRARKARGWTLGDLAESTGSDPGNLSRLERGQQGVSQDLLLRILEALCIPLVQSIEEFPREACGQLRRVPVLCWAELPGQIERMEELTSSKAVQLVACPVDHGPKTFALTVRGESMFNQQGDKSFRDGDIIFVDPSREAAHKSFVIVKMKETADAIFRQLIVEGADRFLKHLNPAWPGGISPMPADATICGVVIFRGEVI